MDAQLKDNSTIADQTAVVDAARIAGVAAIRQACALSDSSNKTEDQEAIDRLEASARNASEEAALATKESIQKQIKKGQAAISWKVEQSKKEITNQHLRDFPNRSLIRIAL